MDEDDSLKKKMSEEEEDIKLNLGKEAKNSVSEDNSPMKGASPTKLIIADKDLKKLEIQVKE